MTLSQFVDYVNKALNYPAVTITDIDLYIDQAFSEINTQLHLSLPSLKEMRDEAAKENNPEELYSPLKVDTVPPTAIQPAPAPDTSLIYTGDDPDWAPYDPEDENVYFDADLGKFIYHGRYYTEVYYMYFDEISQKEIWYKTKTSLIDNPVTAAWFRFYVAPTELNLEEYLPKDWIFLFLIPYVCFKQSVKDGDQGILFNNEMATGFNQLRDSYHIPEKVILKDVIHLPAYKGYAEALKNSTINWYQRIPTRAIYDIYKIPKAVDAVYMDFYNRGGWGI